jgi:hypothetical protein
LLRLYQAAFGLQRATGDAADRGFDARVLEIETCFGQAGLRCFDVGSGDLLCRYRVVVFLLAGRPGFIQGLQSRRSALRLRQPRLRARDVRLGARGSGAERRGIDREQAVAGTHRRPFVVIPALKNAGNAGTHLGLTNARHLADLLDSSRQIPRLHDHDIDLGRRHLPLLLGCGFVAACEGQRG